MLSPGFSPETSAIVTIRGRWWCRWNQSPSKTHRHSKCIHDMSGWKESNWQMVTLAQSCNRAANHFFIATCTWWCTYVRTPSKEESKFIPNATPTSPHTAAENVPISNCRLILNMTFLWLCKRISRYCKMTKLREMVIIEALMHQFHQRVTAEVGIYLLTNLTYPDWSKWHSQIVRWDVLIAGFASVCLLTGKMNKFQTTCAKSLGPWTTIRRLTRKPTPHLYIHTYIHTYVRTYIHTYIHTCMW